MRLPFKIAIRYIFTFRKFQFITFISILSSLGITVGVAALIIVTSIFNGFREFAQNEIVGIEPHIRIFLKDVEKTSYKELQEYLINNHNASVFPFVTFKVIFESNQNTRVVQVFAISDSTFPRHPIVSKFVFNVNSKKLIQTFANSVNIGIGLADALRLLPGESFSLLTIQDIDYSIANFSVPSKKELTVGSIFQTNNLDYDNNYVFVSQSLADVLLKKDKSSIGGLDIRLASLDKLTDIANEIKKNFPNVSVFTWYDLNKDIINAMQFEKYAVFIIMSLIISIAVFNILASLFMTVLEKKSDIATLLTLGSTEKDIRLIFRIQGIIIGSISTVIGLIIGLGFTLGQIQFGWIKLNTQKYVVSTLPMQISVPTIIAIAFVAILLSYLATIYPSFKASKIHIAESIFRE